MTRDPLDILTGGTNPQSTAVDLTNHPVVQAAIEAGYKQEAQIAAAQWVVGVVSRALALAGPFGAAAGHVLTGSAVPADLLGQIQRAQPGATGGGGGSCPLTGVLQNAVPQLLARLGKGG
ncbi:MAG TPA: hypothetical protein VLM89_17410 [Phycisphaerae bacterium]|nr:hypothetical protein [Phycisphaerae bacterium]